MKIIKTINRIMKVRNLVMTKIGLLNRYDLKIIYYLIVKKKHIHIHMEHRS